MTKRSLLKKLFKNADLRKKKKHSWKKALKFKKVRKMVDVMANLKKYSVKI